MAWKCNFSLNLKPSGEVRKAVTAAVMGRVIEGIQDVVADAKHLSPHKTGHNMRSIDWKPKSVAGIQLFGDGTKRNVQVFTTSGYGGYLEVGTRKKLAHPYIMPAYMKHRAAIQNSLKGVV